MMDEPAFDVAVVGAGAAGLTAALTFGREGFRTCLVGEPPAASDGRTVALLDGSVRLLAALGLWPALAADAAPMVRMTLVDDTQSLFRPPPVTFAAGEIGLEAFGWNIANTALLHHLWAALRERGAVVVHGGRATGLSLRADRAVVDLENGGEVEAALAVAADGGHSRLREASGIPVRRWTYPQSALTAILAHDREHRDTSTEFHTRDGPFTLVPLPGRRSSLVWVTRPERGSTLLGLAADDLARAAERQAHSILGAMRLDGPRGLVPLSGLAARRLHGPRLALIGEAAHVLPPIGAQGLNLGLRDVAALRDALVEGRRRGRDPGDHATLAAYGRSRGFDLGLRRAAIDGLNRSLLSDFLPVDLARGAGLALLGALGPLRRAVMREGVLPRLGVPSLMRAQPRSEGGADGREGSGPGTGWTRPARMP